MKERAIKKEGQPGELLSKQASRSVLLLGLLCALLLAAGCSKLFSKGDADDGSRAGLDDALRVLCYGDSNTWGYVPGSTNERYPEEVRWTTRLAQELGEGYEVIPEGLNGRTTAYAKDGVEQKNGLAYLESTLEEDEPIDILVFVLGSNDCASTLDLTPEESAEGMEQLVVTAQEKTRELQGYEPQIIIVVPGAILPDYQDSIFAYQLDDDSVWMSHQLAPLYQQVAEEHGCLFLDGTDVLDVSPVDCEHLTEEGHAQLAHMVAELILSLKFPSLTKQNPTKQIILT